MNRFILPLLTLGVMFGQYSFSQTDSLQLQINEQVWKPFMKSFNSGDTEGFKAVHSKEVIRVVQDDNQIFGYEQYFPEKKQNKESNQLKRKSTLELRFIQRITSPDRAFEIGYFKTTFTKPDGTSQYDYGKFHVLLRKENGTWKILMDADANEKTTEAIFQAGKKID